MTASTGTATVTLTDTDIVRAVFQAFADADAAALGDLLDADATWNHRNNDRLGGVHAGPARSWPTWPNPPSSPAARCAGCRSPTWPAARVAPAYSRG